LREGVHAEKRKGGRDVAWGRDGKDKEKERGVKDRDRGGKESLKKGEHRERESGAERVKKEVGGGGKGGGMDVQRKEDAEIFWYVFCLNHKP
jgi:hypothetical protein